MAQENNPFSRDQRIEQYDDRVRERTIRMQMWMVGSSDGRSRCRKCLNQLNQRVLGQDFQSAGETSEAKKIPYFSNFLRECR